MKLFGWRNAKVVAERKPTPPTPKPTPKLPALNGWTEREMVSVYNACPVRNLRTGDSLFVDIEGSDAFFVILEGSLEVVVNCADRKGRPATFSRGDCIAPLIKSPGLVYRSEAVGQTTIIEVAPKVMTLLPAEAQLSILRAAAASTSRINAFIRSVNGEVSSKNGLLASYICRNEARRQAPIATEPVQAFLRTIPTLPAHAMDLAMHLLQEQASIQEIVEKVKLDPATASIVLKTVNSASYGFPKKIESFYHACMILGFNNMYTLVMTEAVKSTVPVTVDTRAVHNHSCLISVLCGEVARSCKDIQPQMIATAGLLHDVGKSIQLLMKRAHVLTDDYIDIFDSAKLGADLMKMWGLPQRLAQIVDSQQLPEYTPPDLMAPEHRREAGVLHIAHVLEAMIMRAPVPPDGTIYTKDYMKLVGIPSATPEDLLKDCVLPGLGRNIATLPREVQVVLQKPKPPSTTSLA